MRLRYFYLVSMLAAVGVAGAQSTIPSPLLGEEVTKISDNVWSITGFPNIGIVVGTKATLVVDTGLGPRNGAVVARVALRLAPHGKLYLTTTHFHPEHASGEAGFPAGTILIRNTAQQADMDSMGAEMMARFSARNEQQRDLLASATFRKPDVLYDTHYEIDLGGGVKARLLWFGNAHTKGDELVFVLPDKTLISGDVVQNKIVPNIAANGGTPTSWLAVLDKTLALRALHVLPDHSSAGDGSLVAQEKSFIEDLQRAARALKSEGIPVDEAGQRLTAAFQLKYPEWHITSVANFVKSIYDDAVAGFAWRYRTTCRASCARVAASSGCGTADNFSQIFLRTISAPGLPLRTVNTRRPPSTSTVCA